MRPTVVDWFKQHLSFERGARVLDVGALDVNGNLRGVMWELGCGEYVGTDLRAGPNVDVVCRAELLAGRFGPDSFDVVVSSDAAEHFEVWRGCFTAMKQVLRPGGLIALATVCPGYPPHEHPGDYWRWTPEQLRACFVDFEAVIVEGAVCLVARKPVEWRELDLSTCEATPLEP